MPLLPQTHEPPPAVYGNADTVETIGPLRMTWFERIEFVFRLSIVLACFAVLFTVLGGLTARTLLTSCASPEQKAHGTHLQPARSAAQNEP
ncbi:hypothetical protein ABID12_002623 [Martelella mangrovi]|uniref:Uncharacterized protein n=1 Tax=Martelella mangrovi TaxID=1397477 RepID=A0ABV2ICN3_9HYPH